MEQGELPLMIRVAHVAQVSLDSVSGVDKMVVGLATHLSDRNVVSAPSPTAGAGG